MKLGKDGKPVLPKTDAKGAAKADLKGQPGGDAGKLATPPAGKPDGTSMTGLNDKPTNLTGSSPTDLPGGKTTTSSSATVTGRGNDLQIEQEDLVMFDADGNRVLIRPVINPGLKSGQGNKLQAQVQGGGGAPPPMQRPAAANVATIIPGGAGTAATSAALNTAAVAQGMNPDPLTGRSQAAPFSVPPELSLSPANAGDAPMPPPEPPINPRVSFDQAGYRWVPPRGFAIDVRTAAGPTMGKLAKGNTSVLIGGQKGTQHLRTAAGVNDDQAAMMVMAAGYSNLFASDPAMYDAARQSAIAAGEDEPHGMVERMAAGVMAFEGKSFKQTARAKERFTNALYKHAALGSEAYVGRQPGNAYTEGLEARYGKMSPETQAWGVHIFTDPSSPESGWSPRVVPATETLFGGGLPVNASYRAAAANPHVMKGAAWTRPMAVRGVAAYCKAQADMMAPGETNSYKLDALAGHLGPTLPGPDVAACTAIVQESPRADLGEQLIRTNPGIVNAVKAVYATGKFRDYNAAYRAYRGSTTVASSAMGSGGGSGLGGSGEQFIQQDGGNYQGGGGAQNFVTNSGGAAPEFIQQTLVGNMGPGRQQIVQQNVVGNLGPGRQQIIQRNIGGAQAGMQQSIQQDVNGGSAASGGPVSYSGDVNAQMQGGVDQVQVNLRDVGGGPANFNPANLAGLASPKVQRNVNIRFNALNGNTNTTHQTVETSVTGHIVSSDNVQVSGDSSGTVEQTTNVDAIASGSIQTSGQGDLLGIVQKELGARNHVMNEAQTFLVTALNSGFTEEQLQSPQMRQDAFKVFSENPAKMQTAAVVAHAMDSRPGGVSIENCTVVEAMMDAGWSPNKISAPDIDTARAIMQKGGGYPTPRYVNEVRYHPNFSPGPNNTLSQTVIKDVVQDFVTGNRDDIRRGPNGPTYVKPDRTDPGSRQPRS